MSLIHKSYKFRIYPMAPQRALLARHFGACRFVFNYFLNERKEAYLRDGKNINYYNSCKLLTVLKQKKELSWLNEIDSQALQASLRDLDVAYNNFFNKKGRYPRFKSKSGRQSFRARQDIKHVGGKLFIPKFREGIKISCHRKIEGRVLFATVSKDATGKYYASITVEAEHAPYAKTGLDVGIDTGIKDLATLSDGTVYPNVRALKTKLKKLKYQQRQLSKKKRGGRTKERYRRILAATHVKVANTRKDHLHKVTTEIVKNHDVICIEDLAVRNMLKNHYIAQAISDVGLGAFYRMLQYKAAWNERTVVRIGRFFPSSKTCSSCGHINQDLQLKHRAWDCPACGVSHDRDLNAAKIILAQGQVLRAAA